MKIHKNTFILEMNIILFVFENKFECQGFVKIHIVLYAVMNTNYIDELNESQCAAVTYNDGPRW